MIELSLYLEVNLLAGFVLLVLIVGIHTYSAKTLDDTLFQILMGSVLGVLLIDIVARGVDRQHFRGARLLNAGSEALYFTASIGLSVFWMCYAYFRAKHDLSALKKHAVLGMLPAAVGIFMSLLSPKTGWIFYVDAENGYGHGPFFWVQAFICWAYLLTGTILLLRQAHIEHMQSKKRDYRMLASFSLYPAVGSMIQSFHYGTTLVWPLSACALLLIYNDQQQRRITSDALTGINNRGRFNDYLDAKIADLTHNDALFLVLLDVDRFKNVNDTYGHAVGDLTLIRVSEILRRALQRVRFSDFLARYGGDEFAIICRRHYVDEVEQLLSAIRTEQDADNEKHPDGPQISLSMGYARVQDVPDAAVRVLAEADRDMYEAKIKNHARRDAQACSTIATPMG